MISICGRYNTIKKIGCGSFGQIYEAFDVLSKMKVAVKLELENIKHPQVLHEARVIKYLSTEKGIPKIYWYGTEGKYNLMVMELLGPNLEEIFDYCKRKLTLKTVALIGSQVLSRVESVHKRLFIHRDIKPDNFLIGLGKNETTIYLLDFGISKRYIDPNTSNHIVMKKVKSMIGTARYASINSHMEMEQSRRDDIESVSYMLIYFLKGRLPWQGLKIQNIDDKFKQIVHYKMSIPVEELCKNLPAEFETMVTYARNLKFEEEPDYGMLLGLLDVVINHCDPKEFSVFGLNNPPLSDQDHNSISYLMRKNNPDTRRNSTLVTAAEEIKEANLKRQLSTMPNRKLSLNENTIVQNVLMKNKQNSNHSSKNVKNVYKNKNPCCCAIF